MTIELKVIKDFSSGEEIDSFLLIKSSQVRIASNNNKYLDLEFVDKTGTINAKYWEYREGDEHKFVPNKMLKVRGKIQDWKGSFQLKIIKSREVEESDGINIEDFVPSAPIKNVVMYDEILAYKNKISDEELKQVVEIILDEYKEKLMYYPAAKSNHHSIRSGLLYHILRMLRLGENICSVYENLNIDLVFAGIILHDIEKINEMNSNELGFVDDYSCEGKLLGHIIQGVKKLELIGEHNNISREKILLLQHMILTHHYEPEYGSPKKPMIPEAEILHYVDVMDARMYDMFEAIEDVESGEFSDRIWSLDKRQIYKTKNL